MKRLLLAYQLVTGASDTATGLLLLAAPALTLRLMNVHASAAALPYLSYIGAFVLSTGLACLYGASLVAPLLRSARLEVVWLLTALTRGLVALLVTWKILAGALEPAWSTVALFDGVLALLQAAGLARGWIAGLASGSIAGKPAA